MSEPLTDDDLARYEANLAEHDRDCSAMVLCCNIAEAVRPLLDEVRRLRQRVDDLECAGLDD